MMAGRFWHRMQTIVPPSGPTRLQERVEQIECFIVKAAAHHGVVEHREIAAGNDDDGPDHAEHQIDVHQAGQCAHRIAQPAVDGADDGQLVHQPQHRDQQADEHPQQGECHEEQHQRDHRRQQRSQHLLDDDVGQKDGVVVEHGGDGALAGLHDGSPEALRQKSRVPGRDAGEADSPFCRDAGGDLVPEAAGKEPLEHLPGGPAGKLPGPEQADEVARQLHDPRQKSLAGVADGQNEPNHRT